jgi:CRISPR-associated exonuclease Cas4
LSERIAVIQTETPLRITPSDLLEYYFCPRFIYFMYVLRIEQYEKRRYMVRKGLDVHQQRIEQNKSYLWKKLGAVKRESDVYLISDRLHLYGIVDEIVTLEDGSLAPIDYKYSTYPEYIYKSHKTQIISYCLLIEEIFGMAVKQGYIFYVRKGSDQVVVPYTDKARQEIIRDVEHILAIIQSERMPVATKQKARCADCTYKNICVH